MIATTTYTPNARKLINLLKQQNPQRFQTLKTNILKAALGSTLASNTFDATSFYEDPSRDTDWSAPVISDQSFYQNNDKKDSSSDTEFWNDLFNQLLNITYANGSAIKKFKSVDHLKLLLGNALQIYTHAINAGFTTPQILGMLGNSLIESSWNPTQIGGSYKGLFLMGGAERQNYERSYGNNYSIENLINYLKNWRDKTHYGLNYAKAHNKDTNAATSALHFALQFERCSKLTYKVRLRVAAVLEKYLNQLQKAGYFK